MAYGLPSSALDDMFGEDLSQKNLDPAGTMRDAPPSPAWPPASVIPGLNTMWLHPGMELEPGTGFGGGASPSTLMDRQSFSGAAPSFSFAMGEPPPPSPAGGGGGPSGASGSAIPGAIGLGLKGMDLLKKLLQKNPGDLSVWTPASLQRAISQAFGTGQGEPPLSLFGNENIPWSEEAMTTGGFNLGKGLDYSPGIGVEANSTLDDLMGRGGQTLRDWAEGGASEVSPASTEISSGAGAMAVGLPIATGALTGGLTGGWRGAATGAKDALVPALMSGGAMAGGANAAQAGLGGLAMAAPLIIGPLASKLFRGDRGPSWPAGYAPIPGQPNAAVDPKTGAVIWYSKGGNYDWSPQTKAGTPITQAQLEEWYGPGLMKLYMPAAAQRPDQVAVSTTENSFQTPNDQRDTRPDAIRQYIDYFEPEASKYGSVPPQASSNPYTASTSGWGDYAGGDYETGGGG